MTRKRIKRLLKVSAGLVLTFILLVLLAPLPRPLFDAPYATTLRSAEGILLSAAIAPDQQWRFPPSDSIPGKFRIAIRLFEDEYFYYHPGINPVSLARAVRQNFVAGEVVSGGSTITMQTVRMALGNKPRTYFQKVVEIFAALKLEMLFSKGSIMKAYADHAPFGGNIVGINAASRRYFGRPAHLLSWAETATLAILPNNPGSIFPGKNQSQFLKKRNELLEKIHRKGYMNEDELFMAKEEPLPEAIMPLPDDAYHLLHRCIKDGLAETEIQSSIDARLQYSANRIVNDYSRKMAYNQIHNAAAIIVEIESGKTRAYVGNSNNKGEHGQHVDIITARRSPGSLLKPFLYAAALDEGLITPKQLLPDIPVFYKGFAPTNFDKRYRGAVHADDALISSLNVPFVHLLIEYGYEKFHQKMVKMGFHSFDQPAGHYGLSLILGGAETSLWEMTGVYSGMVRALKNYYTQPYANSYSSFDYHENSYKETGTDDKEEDYSSDGYLRAPSIWYTLKAMQQLERPEEEAGWANFTSSRPIAWKTGTSYGFRDGWAIGLNDNYVVGVWIGNADGEGRPGLTGISAAAPLLFELFALLDGDAQLEEPFGMPQSVCRESGMLAGKDCPDTFKMPLSEYMLQASACTYHRQIHLNTKRTHRVNSSCYEIASIQQVPWFVLPPVQAWYYRKFHPNYKKLPPYLSTCRQADTETQFGLIYPAQFSKVQIPVEQGGEKGQVIFEAAHQNPDAMVYWHLDDEYLGYTTGIHQKGLRAEPGGHLLTLVDEAGNEVRQTFVVVDN